jgi:uncharacterized protein (DUF433 family)
MNLPEFLTLLPNGAIRLTGTRIGLELVVKMIDHGCSAETIAEEYDSPTLGQIRQVIDYRTQNRQAIDEYMAECQEIAAQLQAASPPSPTLLELRRRMRERFGEQAP